MVRIMSTLGNTIYFSYGHHCTYEEAIKKIDNMFTDGVLNGDDFDGVFCDKDNVMNLITSSLASELRDVLWKSITYGYGIQVEFDNKSIVSVFCEYRNNVCPSEIHNHRNRYSWLVSLHNSVWE